MAGDITRSTFQRIKYYSSVRMQQGRVQMDADWNEQADIGSYFQRTANTDLIGPSGAPQHDAGFAITTRFGNLLIAPGRIYVDGILCENEAFAIVASETLAPALLPICSACQVPQFEGGS